MPPVPGGTYIVTSTIAGFTDSASIAPSGANTTSSVITIDNQSPGNVTNATGTPGNGSVTLSWTNPTDPDYAEAVVLRATSTITVAPTEGVSYSAGNSINATTTVACVAASSTSGCTDTGLTNGTAYYYKIFAADNFYNYSTAASTGPFTPAGGGTPVVSNAALNGGAAITLVPNSTVGISAAASTTDSAGPGDIRYATSTIYRSGAGPNCTPNQLDCYQVPSSSCAFSGSSSTVTCTANIAYLAQPTDTSTYAGQTWMAAITVTGGAGAGSASTTAGVILNTLLALNVTTSSVNYGPVVPNIPSGNQTTTVQNAGNAPIAISLSGTSLALVGNPSITIPVTSEEYSTATFSWGTGIALNVSTSTVTGFSLAAPTTTASAVQGNLYWAIGGFTAPTGTYDGTISFTASP